MEWEPILEALGATPPSAIAPVAGDLFKAGMRRLAGGVAVVTARSPGGAAVGMTATAFCSLSTDPPTLLVCANRNGSFAGEINVGASFCVNLLSASQVGIAKECAGMAGKARGERFAGPQWDANDAGVPTLHNALVRFECVATSLIPVSTHLLAIAHVTKVDLADGIEDALAYCDGNFVRVRRAAPEHATSHN